MSNKNLFTMVLKPGNVNFTNECLEKNKIVIGWGIDELIPEKEIDYLSLREIIKKKFYSADNDYKSAGQASGMVYSFCYQMKKGDFVIIPDYRYKFYLAKLTNNTFENKESVFFRDVEWIFGKENPGNWRNAKSNLARACKVRRSLKESSYALSEIEAIIENPDILEKTWESDLYKKLCKQIENSLITGINNPTKFQYEILPMILKAMGASDNIVNRIGKYDKGIDLIASFPVAEYSEKIIGIQAKNYLPNPPLAEWVIKQTISGAIAEGLDEAWIVTTGTISEEISDFIEKYNTSTDSEIYLRIIDRLELSKLIFKYFNDL